MLSWMNKIAPFFVVLVAVCFIGVSSGAYEAEAKSRMGGRSFKSSPSKSSTASKSTSSSFSKGMMGGLLGGALGGMLFGSMFGGGGSGMGILPLLILAGIGYFLYRKFTAGANAGGARPGFNQNQGNGFGGGSGVAGSTGVRPPPAGSFSVSPKDDGIAQIRETDSKFDAAYFEEIASDVFFQVQAGWMRRDLDSYRHLLGSELASEYALEFDKMIAEGRTNKLESIAVRTIEVVDAGSDGREDFVTVRFTASLLDYTVDDKTGEVVEGSNSVPIKFVENWSWARPVRSQDWKLEGINPPE
ncbi:MAG: Tim44 domain-containing protein [Desulfotalea sp.]